MMITLTLESIQRKMDAVIMNTPTTMVTSSLREERRKRESIQREMDAVIMNRLIIGKNVARLSDTVQCTCMYTVSQKRTCAKFFLSELCEIDFYFNSFW